MRWFSWGSPSSWGDDRTNKFSTVSFKKAGPSRAAELRRNQAFPFAFELERAGRRRRKAAQRDCSPLLPLRREIGRAAAPHFLRGLPLPLVCAASSCELASIDRNDLLASIDRHDFLDTRNSCINTNVRVQRLNGKLLPRSIRCTLVFEDATSDKLTVTVAFCEHQFGHCGNPRTLDFVGY